MVNQAAVEVREETVTFPTYEPCAADKNPMFIEKRVYQGSSGKVYPLPFIDRVSEQKTDRAWKAVILENEYIKLMMLPEIGGRIHIGQDKSNGYHFLYKQSVIKPALVGLAGPWISGGVEFNWPQHHRPSTFMPVDVKVEDHPDGSKTVWLSEHEPMNRMKGMHGVCLHPGKAYVQLKVRLYNRTPLVHSFLWWANVAARVHEHYQSFFPPDVHYVADHAKRAMSEFPLCRGLYYGVDYRPGTGLDWYRNIPVPTSYMAMASQQDFFGGYDHAAQAGLVHVANHHIAPGKKQWTWGNHEFGYAWDRNLTDEDGPYIELMAGVYTDNQPDFSFLHPYETRTFSQHWYPITQIGPAQHANLHAALAFTLDSAAHTAHIGVSVTSPLPNAIVTLTRLGPAPALDGPAANGCPETNATKLADRVAAGNGVGNCDPSETNGEGERVVLAEYSVTELEPGKAFVGTVEVPSEVGDASELELRVMDAGGQVVAAYRPEAAGKVVQVPDPATEPPAPEDVGSTDELYIIGVHLEQYRHATRTPTCHWEEALRRDPGDARCNNAMGLWHYRRGEWADAEPYFKRAVARLTSRNPNPIDGEAYYNLGLTLRHQGRLAAAYAALYKATWNYAWQSPAFLALAQIDMCQQDWAHALDHLERCLRVNSECSAAKALQAVTLRQLGRDQDAQAVLQEALTLDPLDWWALHLSGRPLVCDVGTRLDVALDYAAAGLYPQACAVLEEVQRPLPLDGSAPLLYYYLAAFYWRRGEPEQARQNWREAATASPDYCFPARLQEIDILSLAIAHCPSDARCRYYLGNLYYDRRRYEEAIQLWEQAVELEPSFSIPWRNLGIAYFNVLHQPQQARAAYDRARAAALQDARVLFERDQLWKRLGESPQRRLAELEGALELALSRDDLSVELCALYNQLGRHASALSILTSRTFQPWEGGEGQALGQWVRTQLALGAAALTGGQPQEALRHCQEAAACPQNLGEARHLLANDSDVRYWLGRALEATGDQEGAGCEWQKAAQMQGDFQDMSVCPFSEQTLFSALSLRQLGCEEAAVKLLRSLLDYAWELETKPAKIDYFATSLPSMLLFDDDIQQRQTVKAKFLQAQAQMGLGDLITAEKLLGEVLAIDPSHALAQDTLREIQALQGGEPGKCR